MLLDEGKHQKQSQEDLGCNSVNMKLSSRISDQIKPLPARLKSPQALWQPSTDANNPAYPISIVLPSGAQMQADHFLQYLRPTK